MNMNEMIWLITGVSSGLGKALAQSVLDKGDTVFGTFRQTEQAEQFSDHPTGRAFGLVMDVTRHDEIREAYDIVLAKTGRLDVLVNNAGFGFAGAVEETSLAEAREVFEANFFGALAITQTFLPLFREQRSGHILQISSHGGMKAFPGFGLYNASKFALEGFSEALAQEIAPLGIRLTLVEPGPFRTQFAGDNFRQAAQILDDYQATAGAFRERMKLVNGHQEGDPVKAADILFGLSRMTNPPMRLPLGKVALATIQSKLDSVQADLNHYRALAESAVH
jgi:NAD(P)-dependent dehydrogenase (short-subunit alcohol dehydrogenase family)